MGEGVLSREKSLPALFTQGADDLHHQIKRQDQHHDPDEYFKYFPRAGVTENGDQGFRTKPKAEEKDERGADGTERKI